MSDELSIPQIAYRQKQIETELQGIPSAQQDMDMAALVAERDYIRAKARASIDVPHSRNGVKLLSGERELILSGMIEDEWFTFESARIQSDYLKNAAKALNSELISLSSRMKAAMQSGNAHTRFGEA